MNRVVNRGYAVLKVSTVLQFAFFSQIEQHQSWFLIEPNKINDFWIFTFTDEYNMVVF